jgi:hypothetical protein
MAQETVRYDANKQPDAKAWLELDEVERIDLIIAYHRHYHLHHGGSAKLHGMVHVIVENQVALGDETVVPETLARLIDEGLDRHDAVHAVGSILMGVIFDAVTKNEDGGGDLGAKYDRELAALTAEGWRST